MDDILIAAHKNKDIDNLLIEMNKEWKVKDLGSISRNLGIRFTQDSKFIYIDQALYLEGLLMSSGMGECHLLKIPIKDLPLPKELDNSALLKEEDKMMYEPLVGGLLWASVCTRPDLQYAAPKLGSKMAAPSIRDMEILKKCLRYVRGTTNAKITFRKNTGKYVELVEYSDASYGSESKRYSQDGYVFLWNGTPVTLSSRRQKSVFISTYQAEIHGLGEIIREIIWVRRLLTDFGFKVGTLPIFGDNQASILSVYNPFNHQTSKNIDTRKNFNEEKVPKKLVKLEHISTTGNIADLFTKALDRNKLTYFRDKLIRLDDSGEINES